MKNYILGVRPGKPNSGWVLLDPNSNIDGIPGGKPMIWGRVAPLVGRSFVECILRCLDNCERHLVDRGEKVWTITLAMEAQSLPEKAGLNQRDRRKAEKMLITAKRAGQWQAVCETRGCEIFDRDGIDPHRWRFEILRALSSEQARMRALKMVEKQWGVKLGYAYYSVAEAIWIAEYARMSLRAYPKEEMRL